MSKIIEEILAIIMDSAPIIKEVTAVNVCIGWGFTAVKLSTGHVGVCHSLLDEQTVKRCRIVRHAGNLTGRPAIELANMARSSDLSESVLGTATVSALSQMLLDLNKVNYLIAEGNFIDYIMEKVKSSDNIALIGRIEPFVNVLQKRVRRLYVFERNPESSNRTTFPYDACVELLPKADIVIITGSSIANKTIDQVLELSRKAREIGVVGPSASIIPDPLFNRGVTIVGGIKPINVDKLLQIIMEGGGTREIKPAVKFITIRPKIYSSLNAALN